MIHSRPQTTAFARLCRATKRGPEDEDVNDSERL